MPTTCNAKYGNNKHLGFKTQHNNSYSLSWSIIRMLKLLRQGHQTCIKFQHKIDVSQLNNIKMKLQIKISHFWTNLISVCTISNMGEMQCRIENQLQIMHKRCKFFQIGLFFNAFSWIFTTKTLWFLNTHFKGLNIDI